MPTLHPDEFALAAPLFRDVQLYAPVPYSVIEGNEPGSIFVNRHQEPTAALVCSHGGYYYLAGDPANTEFNNSLEQDGRDGLFSPVFLSVGLGRKTDDDFARSCNAANHEILDFNPYANWQNKIPRGFCLKSIDEIVRCNSVRL